MTSAPLPDIRIPSDLLPADGRFGSGPSKVRSAAVEELAAAAPSYLGTSHRRDSVRAVVKRIRHGMASLFGLPDGYEVVLGNGGATQFWDIATFGLIEKRSQHLSFGEFSSKFAAQAAAAPHLDAPDVIESAPGTHPEAKSTPGIDTYALTHNETSTGVCMDVRRPADADEGSLVLVDATSAAGGMPVDPRQFDAYYFAPQKCFASEGGLWLAAVLPRSDRADRHASSGGRTVGPRDPRLPPRRRELEAGPDVQHARASPRSSSRRAGRLDARQGRAWNGRRPAVASRRPRSTGGPTARRSHSRSSPRPGIAAQWWRPSTSIPR